MRAFIYTRISLDATGNELGVQRQEAECRRLCENRKWDVVQVFTDNNQSATYGTRPAYKQLVSAIENNECDVVVVYRLDRLLRRLVELEALIELSERTSVQIVTVDGELDLSSPSGRLIGRILASVARSEVEVKGARQKLANRQKAERGLPHSGGRRAFGYTEKHEIREDEARVLRRMADDIIMGRSYKEIAYTLNVEGIRTTTGKEFYPITIRNLLRKSLYAGLREYEGATYKGTWEPIFDENTWSALQATMSARVEKNGKPVARKYLLTGLLVCGKCGLPLNGATKRDHPDRPIRRTYFCRVQGDTQRERGCGGVVRNADALEHFIRELVIARLDTPELGKYLEAESIDELVKERKRLEKRHEALLQDYIDEVMTRNQWRFASNAIAKKLTDIDREIAKATSKHIGVSLVGKTVREAWDKGSTEWRRSLLNVLIGEIVVNPSKLKPFYFIDGNVRCRFDPKSITVSWLS